MQYEILTALVAFAVVTSITPGPNTLMLMTSGANYGLRRSTPHIGGIFVGFSVMVVLVGVGVMRLFDTYPLSLEVLTLFSVAYLLWMAYRIATAVTPPNARSSGSGRPMSFIQAALFQWINPKSWSMAVTAITVYSPSRDLEAILVVAAVFGLVALPCITVWAVIGENLKNYLSTDRRLRQFNWVMATLLVSSLYPVL